MLGRANGVGGDVPANGGSSRLSPAALAKSTGVLLAFAAFHRVK